MDELPTDDYSRLGTNDVTLRWFDPSTSLLIPGDQRPVWMALGDRPIHPELSPYIDSIQSEQISSGEGYTLGPVIFTTPDWPSGKLDLTLSDGRITFAGELLNETDGSIWRGITAWQQTGEPQPTKIFIHILEDDGTIVAQWDGISAEWEGWRPGDTLLQLHEISLSEVPSGTYRVVTGLYDPETLDRWQSTSGQDFIELGSVTVP